MKSESDDRSGAFIPGIYEYCDRWCERCSMAHRCECFAAELQAFDDQASRDPLAEIATQAAMEMKIVPSELESARDGVWDRLRRAETHELSCAAKAYFESASRWLDLEGVVGLIARETDVFKTRVSLDLPGSDPCGDAFRFYDAIELVDRYQSVVWLMLVRALSSFETEEGAGGGPELPRDSDGSAKVALIAMDRSIAAWAVLREHLPEEEGALLDLLQRLMRLRRQTEDRFPAARSFVRPGFDQVERDP